MSEYPEDVMKAEEQWANSITVLENRENVKLTIFRAIMAERERCAKIVETTRVYEIGDRFMIAATIRKGGDAS